MRAAGCVALLALLAGCTDRALPTLPAGLAPSPGAVLAATCRVTMADRSMTCTSATPASRSLAPGDGAAGTRIIGGQELYVKLAQTSFNYDNGTEILSSNVTVQNLSRDAIGTSDGTTVTGVSVFFHVVPQLTSGSGSVSVFNPDAYGFFTASNQPYFLYNQILAPLEVSSERTWQFSFPPTVLGFSFEVYVSANMVDESSAMLANSWTGALSTDWFTPGNWSGNVVPDSTAGIEKPANIPNLSQITSGVLPVLTANASATHLRVGTGSTFDLGAFEVGVTGNVDAVGAVTNGRIRSTGASALLGGTVNKLLIQGAARLQKNLVATGDVAITDGSLTVSDRTLTINIP